MGLLGKLFSGGGKRPQKFRVWFRGGKVDKPAVVRAVQAWAAAQRAAGIEIDASASGSTPFEVQSSAANMFGMSEWEITRMESECPFDAQARMQLMMNSEDADKLFVHDTVALYPDW